MNVDTALGTLTLADLAVPGAESCFASAVRLAAREMGWAASKLSPTLQPSWNLLARAWLEDLPGKDALRAVETGQVGDLAVAQAWPWMAGVTAELVGEAYAHLGEVLRPIRTELARSRRMADQGQCDALQGRVMNRLVQSHATRTATMGQYRRQTGCTCPNPMRCQCGVGRAGPALPPAGGG